MQEQPVEDRQNVQQIELPRSLTVQCVVGHSQNRTILLLEMRSQWTTEVVIAIEPIRIAGRKVGQQAF